MTKLKTFLTLGIKALFFSFIVLGVLYLFTMQKTTTKFANEGKIMCIEKKEWGLLSSGNMECFIKTPITDDLSNLRMTIQNLAPNGEIVLKK
jgi:hypothetical protein